MSPERQRSPDDPTPIRVQLARVALLSTPPEEMLFHPVDGVRYLDIHQRDYRQPREEEGPIVGKLDINYFPGGTVSINHVRLDRDLRRKRIGIEIYRAIPFLPLLDGRDFHESNARFLSDPSDSSDGQRVWRSLARDGFAEKIARGKYEMRVDVPRPDIMFVEEIR